MRELWNRLLVLLTRRSMDDNLRRELEFHLAMKTEETASTAEARRAVGNPLLLREQARDVWGWRAVDEFFRDARLSIRSLSRARGFAVVAILTLGLGIGASTLMFSVADATVIRPFPFPDPERLAFAYSTVGDAPLGLIRPVVYEALRRSDPVMLAAELDTRLTVGGDPYPEQVAAMRVTASYFDVLGVKPLLGRNFHAEEEVESSPNVAMLSSRFWRSHFNGDPNIVGTSFPIAFGETTRSFTIVGIVADEVHSLSYAPRSIWIPLKIDREANSRGLSVTARLKPGVSWEAAQTALQSIMAGINATEEGKPVSLRLTPLQESFTQPTAEAMRMLSLAVAFVLVIACASVANLLLARGADRVKDMSIRAAIGAGQFRLFRQSLTESIMLGLAGGVVGAAIAYFSIGAIRSLIPLQIYRRDWVAMDLRALVFAALISGAASILFGLIPAWRALQADVRPILAGVPGGGRKRSYLRGSLIVAQVSLSLVLVTGAGLLIKSYWKLATKDLGFDRSDLLTLSTGLPLSIYNDTPARVQFEREIEARLLALPGVRFVGLSDVRPLGRMSMNRTVTKVSSQAKFPMTLSAATPGFFPAMGISLLAGRLFTNQDSNGAEPVALVNQSAAQKYWPGESPLGQMVVIPYGSHETTRRIVGMVSDTVGVVLERDPSPMMYVPHAQDLGASAIEIMVRTQPGIPASNLIPALRTELAALHRSMAVQTAAPITSEIYERMARPRFFTTLLSLFAFLALALTMTTVAGVVAYLVRARTYEFGVRLALGARPAQILGLVLRYGGGTALIGTVLGIAGAFALSKVLKAYLFQVEPTDIQTFALTPALLLIAVLFACYIPARRAMRIDPAQCLKHE